jgi:succinate dehydrogenase / fumarate reductase flavoprotein subunit
MDAKVAVFRDEAGIREALEIVRGSRRRRRPPTSTTTAASSTRTSGAIELGYMLDNAECTCVAALERKESRGAQYRTDFPERNDEWLKHIDLERATTGPRSYSR